mmetsp:Transcript_4740/g.8741  ORF Transcript_4740/g.8741 Transcript_4740/m.8741 type:complete len:83 (-) Transcript_4740:94-342(-)
MTGFIQIASIMSMIGMLRNSDWLIPSIYEPSDMIKQQGNPQLKKVVQDSRLEIIDAMNTIPKSLMNMECTTTTIRASRTYPR